jgi:hypothetical protein
VFTTTPVAVPSTAFVEKKAKLRVSNGSSFVHSGVLVWGSDSPVNEELSTLMNTNKNQVFKQIASIP